MLRQFTGQATTRICTYTGHYSLGASIVWEAVVACEGSVILTPAGVLLAHEAQGEHAESEIRRQIEDQLAQLSPLAAWPR